MFFYFYAVTEKRYESKVRLRYETKDDSAKKDSRAEFDYI